MTYTYSHRNRTHSFGPRRSRVCIRLDSLWIFLLCIASGWIPAEAATLRLSAAPGLEDSDVESALLVSDHLLAGTAHGVFAYDGVRWTSHTFADTVRWLEVVDNRVFAGGSRGVWEASINDLSFRLSPDSPPFQRCSLNESESGGALLAGTDQGLFAYDGTSWVQRLDGHRVQSLARHPQKGLLVGSWGDGLLVRAPSGEEEWLACPGAGVVDTLSGNYIHDIAVDSDGTVRLACSWGSLDPRHICYENVVTRGLVSRRDPHTYLRASLCTWSATGWKVTYLLQNFTLVPDPPLLTFGTKYLGTLRGSDRVQWVLGISVGRRLHPRGLVSFDLESREQNWFVGSPARPLYIFPLQTGGGTELVSVEAAPDHGTALGDQSDDRTRIRRVDGRGRHRVLKESDHMLSPADANSELLLRRTRERALVVEADVNAVDSAANALWEIAVPRQANNDSLVVTCVDSLQIPPASLRYFTPPDRFICVRVDRMYADFMMARNETTGERWDLVTDSLRATLEGIPFPAITPVLLPSGRMGALGIDRNAVYLVDRGEVRSWPHSIDVKGVVRWSWMNLLHQDMPQLLMRRREDRGDELWGFSTATPLGKQIFRDATWLELASDDLSSLRRLSRFSPEHVPTHLYLDLAPLFDDHYQLSGWISRWVHNDALPIYHSDGRLQRWLPLPPSLAKQDDLRWIGGAWPLGANGTPTPCLFPAKDYPWPIWRYDSTLDQWIGPYTLDVPFEDFGCNAITALAANTNWWGSEQGLRGMASSSDLNGGRIRGMRAEEDDVRDLVWGTNRVELIESASHSEFERASDLLHTGTELFVAAGSSLLRRMGESWEVLNESPSASLTRRRLLNVEGHLWFQDWSNLNGFVPPRPAGRSGTTPLSDYGVTMFEFGHRRVIGILRISDDNYLMATSWGLHVLRSDSTSANNYVRIPLLTARSAATALILNSEGSAIATLADGRVFRIDPETPTRVHESAWSRPPARAVQQLIEDGSTIWARTTHGIERWGSTDGEILRTWPLPDSLRTIDFCLAAQGGVWIGTNEGLWRVRPHEELALPARPPGLRRGEVSRVVEMDGSRLYTIVDQELWDLPIPRSQPSLRTVEMPTEVVLGLWDQGPVQSAGWAITQYNGQKPRVTRALFRADGATVVPIPDHGRGNHRWKVWAISARGERVGQALRIHRRVHGPSPLAAAAGILGPGFLVGLWALDLRRRARFALWMGASSIGVWLLLYEGLLFELPWGSAIALPAGIAGLGVVLRRRESARHIPVEVAVARLDELLRGFRHRGGGLNPIDELLIHVRNVTLLHETEENFEGTIAGICERVLDATEDLSTQGSHLIDDAQLEPTLLRRFFHRLEELRTLCLELSEDRWRLRDWMQRSDEHLACAELCTSFLQAVESLTHLLARHRYVVVERFFPEYCATLRRRSEVQCDFLNRSSLELLPAKQGEVAEFLDNLVGNSLKACTSPVLRLTVVDDSDGVRLLFEDNGPGVPGESLPRIFDRCYSGTGSSGFGLARCAELATGWGAILRYLPAPHLGGAGFEVKWKG